jgi:FkbM family methyltransferase
MYKQIRNLLIDTANDFPYFIKSGYSRKMKFQILPVYLRLCIKRLFVSNQQGNEKFFGYTIFYFTFESFFLLFREIFFKNVYFFVSEKKDPLIFDCGANIGMVNLFYKWLYPESTIYAFEPDFETFNKLRTNIEQNQLKNIRLYNVALYDRRAKIEFYKNKKIPGILSMSAVYKRQTDDVIRVNSFPLSHFIAKEKIDYLKMDIEGSEMLVLKELIKSKKISHIREMVIEYHHGIQNNWTELASFLEILNTNKFRYRIETQAIPLYKKEAFQDILLYVYRYE